MKQPEPNPDLTAFHALIKAGRLFDVQRWIQAGQKIPHAQHKREKCPLAHAIETGFHSLLECLLQAGCWTQAELNQALDLSLRAGRTDLTELLLAHGALAASVDFEVVCRSAQPELIERFLRAGADPARENAFARALNEFKARPLLRFYRALKDEFPALHRQASLALAEAVSEKKVRWIALLAWAGADPFMKVPCYVDDGWDFAEDSARIAAQEACWQREFEVFKALQLKPTPEQALELMRHVEAPAVMKVLLEKIQKEALNTGTPPSSPIVEDLVAYPFFDYSNNEERGKDRAACLELLLDAGAKWAPRKSEIDSLRKKLLKHPARYVVRIIRLLFYTPGAADLRLLNELYRSPMMRAHLAEDDKPLVKDLDRFQKQLSLQRP